MIDLVKDGFDAFGAAEVQSVDQGASQSHEIGAACKGFEDVAAAADSAVKDDGNAAANHGRYARKDRNGSRPPIKLPPAMVRDPNAISTGLDGSLRVFWRLDAFDEDGQPGEGLDLINIGRNKVRFCRGVNLGNAFADPVLGRIGGKIWHGQRELEVIAYVLLHGSRPGSNPQ